ncbi:hypothetical protein [Sporosarcina obsidiansis]|uniref:hypothetical protein n=1 Tax=Sporosarcina obsidiansis TaxID=2660748 RepID=UPI00129B4AD3|nr:hypothetical protein [Sporosarcina obsidiansis]
MNLEALIFKYTTKRHESNEEAQRASRLKNHSDNEKDFKFFESEQERYANENCIYDEILNDLKLLRY